MASLTLRIEMSDPSRSWNARWSVDGRTIGDVIPVFGLQGRAVLDVGKRFLDLFADRQVRPMADPEYLRAMGRTLLETWFAPALDQLMPALDAGGPRGLIFRTNDPAILDLPWELIEITPGLPIGCDAGWSVNRGALDSEAASSGAPRPGPLRVLFLASAPIEQHQLDYESRRGLDAPSLRGRQGRDDRPFR
jgi:hypothetical protein